MGMEELKKHMIKQLKEEIQQQYNYLDLIERRFNRGDASRRERDTTLASAQLKVFELAKKLMEYL